MITQTYTTKIRQYLNKPFLVFALYWIVLFVLYLPVAQAGRVGDFPGWVKNVSTMKFWDYVNRTESHIPSLYQFTQMVTWFFYQIWGVNAWLWHLLYLSLQAANAFLLFLLCRNFFADAKINNSDIIALGGSLLFCICPHISEVVVWEPSFHYLQGLLLILLVLLCTQKFYYTQHAKYAWYAGILFFLSTWSLEIFYLTPLLVFTQSLYYRYGLGYDRKVFSKSLLWFFVPEVLFFGLHLFLVNAVYHSGIGHIGTNTLHFSVENLSKPLKYIFHILFMGRYFHDEARQKFYHFTELKSVLTVFYGLAIFILGVIVYRFRRMPGKGKAASLLFVWSLLAIGLISLIWFPTTFVVIYDRYTYVADAFIFMLLTLLLSYISIKLISLAAWSVYSLVNVYYTHKANKLWKVSGDIVTTLIKTFPNDPAKTVLVLNVPECYYGVQMIGSRDEGEFEIMYNALMPQKINNPVFEVSAYNITSPGDGAHVLVINDTLLHVTLNQWGTWWWWFGFGAINYENEYYKLNMIDEGHWYELILKKPSSEYLLLYITGDKWHKVDMNNRGDQF